MFYATKQNKYVVEGSAFELSGVNYPANWLNLASAEDKAAIGLVEVTVVGEKKDDRYYWNSETLEAGVLTYTATPKDLDSLKKTSSDQVNATAYSLLFPSDWMVVRAAEGGAAVPADWATYRAEVRYVANGARAAIEACANVEDLIAAVNAIVWPHDPNYVPPVEEPGAV